MKATSTVFEKISLLLAVCCGLFGFTFSTLRAEGSGVGGGNLPPPKSILITPSCSVPAGTTLLSDGRALLPDGTITTLY